MELFPHRVSKAVYVAAAMLTSGQSTLDMFSQKADSNDLMCQAQIFLYANGNTQPPTAINLDKSLLRDLLFNQSPAKAGAIFLKLTEEKNRVLQQNDKLRQELELFRHGHAKSSGGVNLLYIVLVGLIGILMRYFMRKS